MKPLVLFVLLAAASASATEGAAGGEGAAPDHVGIRTEIVAIAPDRLAPTVKLVGSTEALGWINYTSRVASIEFDASVAETMMCTGPSPFRIDGDQLRAPQVSSGGFATVCKLAPGEYDYRVVLRGAPKPLLGKLVVAPNPIDAP